MSSRVLRLHTVVESLFGRIHDLHMMMFEQIARRVIHLCNGHLKINLRLNQVQLGLCELSLRVEDKEDLFRAQFILSFVGVQRLLCQIHGHFGSFHPELGGFERMHGARNVQQDALIRPSLLILIVAPADQGIGQICFRAVIFYR